MYVSAFKGVEYFLLLAGRKETRSLPVWYSLYGACEKIRKTNDRLYQELGKTRDRA